MLANDRLLTSAYRTCLIVCLSTLVASSCTHESADTDTVPVWTRIGPGGGGAMFHHSVSPHNPDWAWVACDMTGSYVTSDGGRNWGMYNLHGVVRWFATDPGDAEVVYANSIGLYRSADAGRSWNLFYPNPDMVTGIVAKGDHADEQFVLKDSSQRAVLAFAVDPKHSDRLYAAIRINEHNGLYRSFDAGLSWVLLGNLPPDVLKLLIDPSSPDTLRTVVVLRKTGVTKYSSGQFSENGLPARVSEFHAAGGGYDSEAKRIVIYGISGSGYFSQQIGETGIFFSDDAGDTWNNRQAGLLQHSKKGAMQPEYRALGVSEGHPQTLYVSYNNLQVGHDSILYGVARSVDFGKSWQLVWADSAIAGKHRVAGNWQGGWLDQRFGPSWGENPFSIGVSATDPDVCYVGDFGRTARSIDGGKTWQQLYTSKLAGGSWQSTGLDVTTTYSINIDPFDKNHILLPTTDIGLLQSADGGKSWSSATYNNGVPDNWVNTTYWLSFDTAIRGRVWAAMSGTHDLPRPKMFRRNNPDNFQGGLLRSDDGGKSWTPVSAAISEGAFTHVFMNDSEPDGRRALYVCVFGKGVYKSYDEGASWQIKNTGLPARQPFAWQITRRDSDSALLLVVSRRSEDSNMGSDGDGALFISHNAADSWEPIAMPAQVNGPTSLLAVPGKGRKLVLAAWGRKTAGALTPDTGGGIFMSDDDGKSWQQTLKTDQHVNALSVDHASGRLYACGFSGAAWMSDDTGATWQRIRGYNFKWGQRVEPDPSRPGFVYILTFGGGAWHGKAIAETSNTEIDISKETIFTQP